MQKINFIQQYPSLFSAGESAEIVTLPARCYLSIEGVGVLDKNSKYQEAKHLVQGLAFLIKHTYKQNPPLGFFDYTFPPFEIIRNTSETSKDITRTILLLQPNYVQQKDVDQAIVFMKNKHEEDVEKMPTLAMVSYPEEKAVQIHHTGSYTAQKRSCNAIEKIAKDNDLILVTKKHEVFLKNPLTSPPGQSNILIRYKIKT